LCDNKQFLLYPHKLFYAKINAMEHLLSKNTNIYLYCLRVPRVLVNVATYDLSVLNFLLGICKVKDFTS